MSPGPPADDDEEYENSQDISDIDAEADAAAGSDDNLQFSGSEDEDGEGDKGDAGGNSHSSDDGGDAAKKDPLDFTSESGSDSNMFGGESSGGAKNCYKKICILSFCAYLEFFATLIRYLFAHFFAVFLLIFWSENF